MKIIVTGGSGMVGRSLDVYLIQALPSLSKDYDLTSELDVIKMFETYKPDTIIHLAAKVGGIIDNINKPAEYFDDNILMNTLLLKYSLKYNITRFIGILSTCIYPDVVENYPMLETDLHLGPPTKTNFSYGYAKRSWAVQRDAYTQQYGTKYQYLIPCNLYGENDKFGENGLICVVVLKQTKEATMFIENWFMSCRVLKRGMENFVLNTIVNKMKLKGVKQIEGEYIPSTKNQIVVNHYNDLGFTETNGKWVLDINSYLERETYINFK